jgi:acyl dehydratase
MSLPGIRFDGMAINQDQLLSWQFSRVTQSYTERDAIIYALGIGLGENPLDKAELAYLIEGDLRVLPTMAVTLATLGMWVKEPALGIDWVRLVHAAQAATFHAPLPAKAEVYAKARITSVTDRGAGKGAVITLERQIYNGADDTLLCSLVQTLLARGDGGFGGEPPPKAVPFVVPDRPPDVSTSCETSPRAALIYRLSGDLNPLHAVPEVAARAGFERPILHGLASYGIAGWVILRELCGSKPEALESLALRFAGIVTPGDRLSFRLWREGNTVVFTAHAGDRLVLDQGVAQLKCWR